MATTTITLDISEDVIQYIKDSDGTRYWVDEDGFEAHLNFEGDTFLVNNGHRYNYDTETCLKGIVLWVQNGGNLGELLECDTDHYDHDSIWQYGFFGELVYG